MVYLTIMATSPSFKNVNVVFLSNRILIIFDFWSAGWNNLIYDYLKTNNQQFNFLAAPLPLAPTCSDMSY